MSLNSITNQAIALAGIAQCCHLVHCIATTGQANQSEIETCIHSLLKLDSDEVIDTYGSLASIKPGLTQLEKQVTGHSIGNPEQGRYAASLVFLHGIFAERKDLLKQVTAGIEKAKAQSETLGLIHEDVIATLGDLYHDTISTLQPRIMVNGDETYLAKPGNVNLIRALLLAGIRSVHLWRQCGGAKWKFLIYRKKLQDEIQYLLELPDN